MFKLTRRMANGTVDAQRDAKRTKLKPITYVPKITSNISEQSKNSTVSHTLVENITLCNNNENMQQKGPEFFLGSEVIYTNEHLGGHLLKIECSANVPEESSDCSTSKALVGSDAFTYVTDIKQEKETNFSFAPEMIYINEDVKGGFIKTEIKKETVDEAASNEASSHLQGIASCSISTNAAEPVCDLFIKSEPPDKVEFCEESIDAEMADSIAGPSGSTLMPSMKNKPTNMQKEQYITSVNNEKQIENSEEPNSAAISIKDSLHSKSTETSYEKESLLTSQSCSYISAVNRSVNIPNMPVYSEERPFSCRYCSYLARTNAHLQAHIRSVHNNERPFTCEYEFCSYKASSSGHLQSHIRYVHSKERPFSCQFCLYEAAQKGHLRRHIKAVHNKERPFSCGYCSYKAAQNGTLKGHIKSVHNKD